MSPGASLVIRERATKDLLLATAFIKQILHFAQDDAADPSLGSSDDTTATSNSPLSNHPCLEKTPTWASSLF